jgi:Lrp/AsnC family transcriptional regulator for asnA, asnC and gidA
LQQNPRLVVEGGLVSVGSPEDGPPTRGADEAGGRSAGGSGDAGIRDASGRLDARSKRIIEQLQEDGRRSYAAIARAVGLSEAATRQRVQRLLDERVIQIAAVTDAAAVGFRRQAMLGIRVDGDVRSVSAKLTALPEASYVVICAGQFDLLVELVCEDDEHLLAVIDNGVRSIPGVRTTETFLYLRLEKESYQWGTR